MLVNSQSPDYTPGFQHLIQPYLDHFGIPYTTLNISTTAVTAAINEYALIIIGHRNLDSGGTNYLNSTEQGYISAAVNDGSGLVNFDNALSANGSTGRYEFINSVFTFGYNSETSGSGVKFLDARSCQFHYCRITRCNQNITTATMNLAGITLPGDVTPLATSDISVGVTQPFLAVTTLWPGPGRAVRQL